MVPEAQEVTKRITNCSGFRKSILNFLNYILHIISFSTFVKKSVSRSSAVFLNVEVRKRSTSFKISF